LRAERFQSQLSQEWTFWLLVTLKMLRGGSSDPPRAFLEVGADGFKVEKSLLKMAEKAVMGRF
jgi:hypothetical protein